ncbi:hypothetical protein [Pseudohaliea rubra]|uniref:hypothetical protein n=1 Tax=Pseudohaliea rubra TaxID=475795 RepID=UPI001185A2AA|nr:hypothetical protein [Pseudohaliea rubra]
MAPLAAFALGLFLAQGARALSLGPDEFVAARQVTCILAQDALGYLGEDAFNTLLDGALENFDDGQGDVIYAKALGYFDGLMFGIPAGDDALVSERLRAYNQSQACSGLVVSNYRL